MMLPSLANSRFLTAMDGSEIDIGTRAVPCMADMNQ